MTKPQDVLAELAYSGQHDDCIATVPHYHARPYRTGDWGSNLVSFSQAEGGVDRVLEALSREFPGFGGIKGRRDVAARILDAALVRTPETLDVERLANALDSVDIDEFDTLGAFDSTGYARAILAVLPCAATPSPTPPEGLTELAERHLDRRNPPPGHAAWREPELPASEWRAAYFVLARIALEQLDECRAARTPETLDAAGREARAAEIAAGLTELGTGGTPAFIRGYNAGYDDAYEHARTPETLDAESLLATLRDRFHEARAGTPEWRDGVRLGLQIAMNEVGYAAAPTGGYLLYGSGIDPGFATKLSSVGISPLAATPSPTPPEGLRNHAHPQRVAMSELRPAASPAPDPGAGLREAAEKAVHLVGNYLWNEDGENDEWLVEAHSALRDALMAAPSAEPPETT